MKHRLKRHAIVIVPHTLASLYSLPGTELIALVLQRVAKQLSQHLALVMQPAPFTYPPIQVHMVWHPKNRNSSSHQWLIKQIREISRKC